MPLVTWKDEYSVHKEVDEQHKKFFDAINKLDTVKAGDREALGTVLDALIDYAAYHFSTEERLMQRCKFPECDDHTRRHEKFMAKVLLYKKDFLKGKDIDPNEVMDWTGNWLLRHILQRDQQIKPYVAGKPKR